MISDDAEAASLSKNRSVSLSGKIAAHGETQQQNNANDQATKNTRRNQAAAQPGTDYQFNNSPGRGPKANVALEPWPSEKLPQAFSSCVLFPFTVKESWIVRRHVYGLLW